LQGGVTPRDHRRGQGNIRFFASTDELRARPGGSGRAQVDVPRGGRLLLHHGLHTNGWRRERLLRGELEGKRDGSLLALSELQDHAVLQLDGADALSVQVRAVLAVEVGVPPAIGAPLQAGMFPRNDRGRNNNVAFGKTTQVIRVARQFHLSRIACGQLDDKSRFHVEVSHALV